MNACQKIQKNIKQKKETKKIDKVGNDSVGTMSYKKNFIDSIRFMETSYQILLIIPPEEFPKLNAKIMIVFLNIKESRKVQ